jgi:adenosylcobinamide-GDP ribazoletransferase
MPLLFITTPYQRASGLASAMHQSMPESALRRMLLLVTVATLLLADVGVVLVSLLVFLLLRYLMERRLGGFTGDTAGAMIELLETTVLLYFVLS